MTRAIFRFILVFALLFQGGCATMFNGSKETIAVDATSNRAKIYVNGRYVGQGQARTTIPKKGNVTITARRSNCRPHSVRVDRTFDPTTLLGLFVDGGIFSILIIDGAATGAWSKATQQHYRLATRCNNDTSRDAKNEAPTEGDPPRRVPSRDEPRSRADKETRRNEESRDEQRARQRNEEQKRVPSPEQQRLSDLDRERQVYLRAMRGQRHAPIARELGKSWGQIVQIFEQSFEQEKEALRAGELKRRRRIRITREFTAWLLFEGADRASVAILLENSPINAKNYSKVVIFALAAMKGDDRKRKTVVEQVVTSNTDMRMSAKEVAAFESIAE